MKLSFTTALFGARRSISAPSRPLPRLSWHSVRLLAVTAVGALPISASAATYVWNNTGSPWETLTDWTPNTPAGGPTTADIASFDPTVANSNGTIFNPTINAADTALSLNLNDNYLGGTYSFTGAGSLTTSNTTAPGLETRGYGTSTINIGNGTATSLTLTGPTTSGTGNINVGTDTTLVLTGNTVATTSNTGDPVVVRGGDLVLDNTVGGANTAHLATTGTIQLNGGGATLELRGNSAGTNFGTLGILGASGSGDNFVRTVQSGAGALSVTFASMSRANTSGIQYFENIGTGFVGDSGKPTIAFTTAPSTVTGTGGLISSSATTVIPYAIVTNRASNTPTAVVTGRWAAYNNGTVGAVATTAFTGDFSGAAANTNVLFAPGAGTTTLAATTAALASVVLEPTASGATLALGANKIVTSGLLLSGGNDLTVTGTGQLAGNGTATESVSVLSPGTSLITSDVLSTATTTTGGAGFLILNGTANQVPFTAANTNFNLGGGVLRVTSTNFVLNTATNATAPVLRFRGGVLEYDVSGGNYTFGNALGAVSGNVSWTSNSPATSNAGGGGFSAYSTTPGNTLTVNLGGASAPLQWDTANFVPDGYALKFGSIKSNAMVNFQNPIALDGGTAGTYNAREINVVGGVGGDGTILSGAISGSASTDLLKTGTGLLVLGTTNTYAGHTLVEGGTLQAAGPSGAGALNATAGVIVGTTGMLQMGVANQFNATTPAPVTLNGATGSGNAATFSLNGFSQGSTTTVGVGGLTLAATSTSNVLDFNGKAGVISFASFTPNGAILTVNNYLNNSGKSGGPDELIFDQSETSNLGEIVFTGYGSTSQASLGGGFFEVFPTAPVPEPGATLDIVLAFGFLTWSQRRRVAAVIVSMRGTAGV